MEFSYSKSFFELSAGLNSGQRIQCVKEFIQKLLILPFACFFKIYKTFFRLLGVSLSAAMVLLSLGLSESLREWFVRRVLILSKDLSDWFLWPLSILAYLIRLIFALLCP